MFKLFHVINRKWEGRDLDSSSSYCNRWVARLNPWYVHFSHCFLGQDTSSYLPAGDGQRALLCCVYASNASVSVPQGSYDYNLVHHQCVTVCVNDCKVLWDPLIHLPFLPASMHFIGILCHVLTQISAYLWGDKKCDFPPFLSFEVFLYKLLTSGDWKCCQFFSVKFLVILCRVFLNSPFLNLAVRYLHQGGYVFVSVCRYVCLLT